MNIDGLVNKYFKGQNPTIEVFDEQGIHQVYSNVVNILKACPDIELGVLQLLSYCFYEILDNVVTHSGKRCGTVISQYLPDGTTECINKASQWQGTILFMEIHANKEIEPNAVLLNRVDVEDEFNDTFLDIEDIDNLW